MSPRSSRAAREALMSGRYFPSIDTVTREQYRRLVDDPAPPGESPTPLPGRAAAAAVDPRARPCFVCGTPFVPVCNRRTDRFCSTPCRRWWHYGPGAKERKALAS